MSPLLFLAVLASAWLAMLLFTPLAIRLGRKLDIVDRPGGRRKHHGEIVRIGGLGLFPAFAIASLIPVLVGSPRDDALELTRLTGVLLGMAIVWVMGLLDDKFKLSPGWQLAGLVAGALVAILFKVFVERFNSPFGNQQIVVDWYLMLPISLAWIVGMTNLGNSIDGLDGLAAGVTAIASAVLFIHMLRLHQYSVALLPLALLGCCLGFLHFNLPPARVFLGGGAYVLGFGIATLSIISGAKVASALLVMWLPIVDLVWQVYSRWHRGQRISLGDRGHLHLRLQDLGWSQRRIVLMYYGITAFLGAVGLLVPNRALKLGALIVFGLAFIWFVASIAQKSGDSVVSGE
ncbi:MAG: glycosyltransferase family 4 protein [Anaerolineae bacterium]|jgi:UDP-GlcNAc:undecaprenyl-phosphate GlcNAc-1-phosphate transferase|nr:undecaprenyl/decaprenyl-phosphate alpha-N-acetylglucosaminyl 1-phosphate transferase [Chloroflexota bacterium]